jgi:hypothetical protein
MKTIPHPASIWTIQISILWLKSLSSSFSFALDWIWQIVRWEDIKYQGTRKSNFHRSQSIEKKEYLQFVNVKRFFISVWLKQLEKQLFFLEFLHREIWERNEMREGFLWMMSESFLFFFFIIPWKSVQISINFSTDFICSFDELYQREWNVLDKRNLSGRIEVQYQMEMIYFKSSTTRKKKHFQIILPFNTLTIFQESVLSRWHYYWRKNFIRNE